MYIPKWRFAVTIQQMIGAENTTIERFPPLAVWLLLTWSIQPNPQLQKHTRYKDKCQNKTGRELSSRFAAFTKGVSRCLLRTKLQMTTRTSPMDAKRITRIAVMREHKNLTSGRSKHLDFFQWSGICLSVILGITYGSSRAFNVLPATRGGQWQKRARRTIILAEWPCN